MYPRTKQRRSVCSLTTAGMFVAILAAIVAPVCTLNPSSTSSLSSQPSSSSSSSTYHTQGPRAPIIKEHPSTVIVKKQKPATLSCKADGEPTPIIEWYKDNELIQKTPNYIFLPTGDLFILKVSNHKKDKDTGIYHCLARNEHGKARSHNASIEIASIRDDFRALPKNVWAAVGDVAVLECSPPRGHPEPEVKWRRNGDFISIDGRIRISGPGNLVISDLQPEDAGSYQCVAQNMAGQRESTVAQLNVRVKPYFIRKPEDITAVQNEVAELTCRIGGDPTPKVSWRRERGKMPNGRTFITEDKSLRISHVTEEDEGIYVCEAENVVGQVSAAASLVVHSRPSFVVEPHDFRSPLGGVARFECVATGNPRPSVFWTKEGSQILMFPDNKYGHFTVTSDGALIVNNVRRDDGGFYVCSALSVVGSSTSKAFLNVTTSIESPPPIISLAPADQTLPEHTTAIFPCDSIGGQNVRWSHNDSPIPLGSSRFNIHDSGTLQIDGLQIADSGVYRCTVSSANGETSWTAKLRVASAHSTNTMFHKMPDPSTFPDPPSRPVIVNSTSDSVTLSWRRPGREGASPIRGAIVEYFSPDHNQEWIHVANGIADDIYTVRNLKPASRYLFLVRLQNSHGIGLPSPISLEAKTEGGKQYDLLSPHNEMLDGYELKRMSEIRRNLDGVIVELRDVQPLNASAVLLTWHVHGVEHVEGYYVRYRKLDTDFLHEAEQIYDMVTIHSSSVNSYIITNLPRFSTLEFFLVPFYRGVDGRPSNTRIVKTYEDAPKGPPSSIKIRPLSPSSALISWIAPESDMTNGPLLGFQILVQGTYFPYRVNLTVPANTTSYVLRNLTTETEYLIQISAFNLIGLGPFSAPLTFIIDPLLSGEVYSERAGFDSNVWISVLIISLVILSLIVLLLGFLLYKKRSSILKKGQTNLALNRELKAQGPIFAGQWQYSWKNGPRSSEVDPKNMTLNGANGLKLSSSFHPSDNQGGYSTVTTDEPGGDYAEVSGTENNYEAAYYATSNDPPMAYASSNILKNNFASQQTWNPASQGQQPPHHPFNNKTIGAKQNIINGRPQPAHFATLDRNHLAGMYNQKNSRDAKNVFQQQTQPLIGAFGTPPSNEYEDASLFYQDSVAYNSNVTQIPQSRLVTTNQFKFGSLSRIPHGQAQQQSQLGNNELAKSSYMFDNNQRKWEPPQSPKNRGNKFVSQQEIESQYKPQGYNRHVITNPLLEQNSAAYRPYGRIEDFKNDRHQSYQPPVGGDMPTMTSSSNINCDNEPNLYQELP